jgi:hypothetical protein
VLAAIKEKKGLDPCGRELGKKHEDECIIE